MQKITLLLSLILVGLVSNAQEKVNFLSLDELLITADFYGISNTEAPIIILCHQAGWSRGEYKEIAPILNDLGFNCLAIDQRSGRTVNGIQNETHQAANKLDKKTTYIDAEQDIVAALNYVNTYKGKSQTVILWGSSYSAALALKIAAENDLVYAVVSFSPGEYFSRMGKSETFITDAVQTLNKPVFITASQEEEVDWKGIFNVIPSTNKTGFVPKGEGKHGSRNLWAEFSDHEEYWEAVTIFLNTLK